MMGRKNDKQTVLYLNNKKQTDQCVFSNKNKIQTDECVFSVKKNIGREVTNDFLIKGSYAVCVFFIFCIMIGFEE